MPRPSKKIDPVAVTAIALKHVKSKEDDNRICGANTQSDVDAAWQSLSDEEKERINGICKATPQSDFQAIAQAIISCGTYIQLQALKAEHGETVTRAAWKLIPVDERRRLKALCDNEQKPKLEVQPVSEPATNQVELQPESKIKTRSLFSISDDLEKLNELLDECDGSEEQQKLIQDWLEQLGSERDSKLDSYAALITELLGRAELRKAEAKRLAELAASDESRAKLLKDRLKLFFELHDLKTVQTSRYKLSLTKNGGKAPLILDEAVPATKLPEQFQRISIDADIAAIREVLERGEKLDFAQLGERGTSLRIK